MSARRRPSLFWLSLLFGAQVLALAAEWPREFRWKSTAPLIDVASGKDAPDPYVALKDPTFVFAEGAWHLFATLRMKSGRVDMAYLHFTDSSKADDAKRTVLGWHNQYYCAPHLFYFTPHNKWYLVYQLGDTNRTLKFGPYFSTTTKISDVNSWTKPEPMIEKTEGTPKWLDFWVICDDTKAYLFYTSLDGHLWRRETPKEQFPFGWGDRKLSLKADIFEASCTYKIKGANQYLTLVEAIGNNRRYYKAFIADRLDGEWKPLADSLKNPFASHDNVEQNPKWTANISHGELFRSSNDERLEIDPANLRFLFQGASDHEYRTPGYGGIPWRLGILEASDP